MIKNERQFRLTRAQVSRLRTALDDMAGKPDDGWQDLELAAVQSQIDELEHQLSEYTALREGRADVGIPTSLSDIPRLLIRQRISHGLTQRDLAERLDMKEQQVQRYEADDWATASIARLVEVADAVGLSLVSLPVVAESNNEATPPKQMLRALKEQGVEADFLTRRFRPTQSDAFENVVYLTARLNRVFGWDPSDIVAGDLGPPESLLAAAASFKLPKRTRAKQTHAYTVYSQYLALLTLDATSDVPTRPLPGSAGEMRALIVDRHGSIAFPSILSTTWDLGIPVLPLADPGAFHAVLWRASGRNVIVLKQPHHSPSRWAFDLLHEMHHAGEEPEAQAYAVIDDDDTKVASPSERRANRFAGDVLLDGRAEQLAEEAVERARGSVERLKKAVPTVAEDNQVATADLANYLAHRLALQGIDWWGTAHNLQGGSNDAWDVSRRQFLSCVDVGRLAKLDRDLLLQALVDRHD